MADNYKYFVPIRFKSANKSYNFGTDIEGLKIKDQVVVETARGIELGEIVKEVQPIVEYSLKLELKPIKRKATKKDSEAYSQNLIDADSALKQCEAEIKKLNLDMNLISAEYTLDRTKITFVYVSDERVDFRELLKILANLFKCRIDLRQIGSRDKAKIVGGIGVCGQETCCSRFLSNFDIVSINMAKNQMLALNIQKLSGQCGKLMCCLKFEDEAYKELKMDLPKINSLVEYNQKKYKVTSINVISGLAKLENANEAFFINIDELKPKGKKHDKNTKKHK